LTASSDISTGRKPNGGCKKIKIKIQNQPEEVYRCDPFLSLNHIIFLVFFGETLGNVWFCVSFKFDFFFFAKIECGLYFLDRFDVLMSKMIFKK